MHNTSESIERPPPVAGGEVLAAPSPGCLSAEAAFRTPTIAQLCEWVRGAQPNARLTYAQGEILSQCCRGELKDKVWQLAVQGFLTPHYVRRRDGEPSRHIVQRTQRPYLKGMQL